MTNTLLTGYLMRLKIATGLLAIMLLSSCALLNKNQVSEKSGSIQTTIANPTVAGSSPLDYAAQFSALSADAQKKEQQQLVQLVSQSKNSVEPKIKLAIIYSLPASRLRDPAKAQNLLDEILRSNDLNNTQKNLCQLLKDFSADYAKLGSRIREEQKRADLAQTRADLLQQKLEELKNIEKTMMIRDQGNSK